VITAGLGLAAARRLAAGGLVAALVGGMLAPASAQQTVTWTGSGDTTWSQPDATSWSATYASGDNVVFTTTGGPATVTISGTVTPGSVLFNSGSNYTLSGAIGGTGGVTKRGSARLSLGGAVSNSYSGTTTVTAGTLNLLKTSGIAIPGDLSVSNAQVTINADGGGGNNQIADTANVSISGSNSWFNGTAINTGALNYVDTFASLSVTNTAAFQTGGGGMFTITGGGTFSGGGWYQHNSGAIVSFGSLSISGLTGTGDGAAGFQIYGNSTGQQSAVTVGSGGLTLNGSTINLRRGTGLALGSRLVLNGDLTTTGVAASRIAIGDAGSTGTGAADLQLSSTSGSVVRSLTIGGGGANLTVAVPITNGSATAAGIRKLGVGLLTLGTANSYTGATTISAGTLALAAAGSFANSPAITIGDTGSSGAVLDLTAKTGTFAFTSGQTVGGIGTINIGSGKTVSSAGIWAPGNSIGSNAVTGNLALSGTSQFELGTPGTSTSAPGLSDFTAVSGTLTLGGNLQLINNAGADGLGSVAGGVYRLFTYGNAVSGSFASVTTNPSATTVTRLGDISYGGSGTAAGQGVFLTVYDRAVASFTSGSAAQTTLTLDFGSVNEVDVVSPLNFSLFNLLQTAGYTADLALIDIAASDPSGPLSTNLSLFNSLASGTFNSWQAYVNTANQGTFTNTWTLQFKSANGGTVYSGDTTQTLTLTAQVIVVPEPGAIVLAGLGIAAAAWAYRRRRS
jgi:autotransporter-associated beta strand protein